MTVFPGDTLTLTAEWRAYSGGPSTAMTGVQIVIAKISPVINIVGPTSVGVTAPAVGVNAYSWTVGLALIAGDYLVSWLGTDPQGDTVTATEIVTVTSAPAGVYGDLTTLKAALQIPLSDTTRDARLLLALRTSSEQINTATGRTFNQAGSTATTRVFDTATYANGDELVVDPIGDLTGLAVGVSAGAGLPTYTALTAGTYGAGPDNAIAKGQPVTYLRSYGLSWSAYSYVQVTARWDWPVTPYAITQASLLQASRIFRRADSPEGVVGSAEWGAIRVSRLDPDVQALISPYSLPGFA